MKCFEGLRLDFEEWLKSKNAFIFNYDGNNNTNFDYYYSISGVIGSSVYSVIFLSFEGKKEVDYNGRSLSISQFKESLKYLKSQDLIKEKY